jgi:hypothetical protein
MNNNKLLLACLDLDKKYFLSRISINDKNFIKKVNKQKRTSLIFCSLNEFISIKKRLKSDNNIKRVLIVSNHNKNFSEKLKSLIKIIIHCNLLSLTFVRLNKYDFYVNTFFPFNIKFLENNLNSYSRKIIFFYKNFIYFLKNNYLIIYC